MKNNQIKGGAIVSYITIAFYIITGLLYTPFLVKTLGMSDYGLFSLSASIIAYLSIDFGIGAAQTRFITKYIAEGKEDKVKDLLGITTKLYLGIDLIIIVILTIVYQNSEQIFTQFTQFELERFKTIFLISSFFVLFNFPLLPINGIFIAYEKIITLKLFDLASKVISVSLLVTALALDYGLYGVVLVNACATLAVQSTKLIYLYKKLHVRINIKHKDKIMLNSIGAFSLWATIAMIADKFFFAIIPTLLAIFSDTYQIALFAIVISIEGYVLTFAKALNGLYLPKVMKLVVDQSSSEQQTNLMIKVGRIQLYIVGLLIVGLVCFGKEFFHHWLGDGFNNSYYAMVIVLIPCLFHLTQTIAEELIYAKNKIKYRAYAYIIGSLLSVATIAILSPRLGAIGAAIGVSISFIFAHNIIIDIFYHKILKINMLEFFKECHIKILPSFIIAGCIGYLIQEFIPTHSFIAFGFKGIIWVLIYLLINWKFSLNKEEKEIVKLSIKKIYK